MGSRSLGELLIFFPLFLDFSGSSLTLKPSLILEGRKVFGRLSWDPGVQQVIVRSWPEYLLQDYMELKRALGIEHTGALSRSVS